jgi:hypothetical protein
VSQEITTRKGMGGHQSTHFQSDVWLTPPHIIEVLGPFDLDPASPVERPWPTATKHYTPIEDGLKQPWQGTIWLNPPYGLQIGEWLARLREHGDGFALIFARTETKSFFDNVWGGADAILFLKGRIAFYRGDGKQAAHNGGAPSCIAAYGQKCVDRLRSAVRSGALAGAVVEGWR